MVYLGTLKVALDDGIVTGDEMAILDVLAGCIGISKSTKRFARDVLDGVERNPISDEQNEQWSHRQVGDATCYQSALITALDDDVISDDEMALLDCLRRAMGLQPDEHALVEESVRVMIENQEDERLMQRLESYLTTYPGA